MLIGLIASAMMLGGVAATTALFNGYSILAALALYSGCGALGMVAVALAAMTLPALRDDRMPSPREAKAG